MKQVRRRLIYANVMASLAAFLVLGGGTASAAPGGAPEELPPLPSSIGLKCSSSVQLGQAATCTATVTGGVNPFFPRGQVSFSRTEPGSFNSEGACTLVHLTGNKSRCQVTYTPNASGSHTVGAFYAGEGGTASRPGLEPSEASATIQVFLAPTRTSVSCGSGVPFQEIACTVSVVDLSAIPTVPTGRVSFSPLSESGAFEPRTCVLVATGSGAAGCSAPVVARVPGTFPIVARYGGDPTHGASVGEAAITIGSEARSSR